MIAVVVPCLNEESRIEATCASLGFGPGETPPDDSHLVLVDNGSIDTTMRVLAQVRDHVGRCVHVARETTRGHVPARVRGIEVATNIAAAEGTDPARVVIVQCDADAHYSRNYVTLLASAVLADPHATLATAIAGRDPDFESAFPALSAAVGAIDQRFFENVGRHEPDTVVDDKTCAYSLAAYHRWGGHRRERRRDGSELLAETTRLFMAAQGFGARRVEVAEAVATHSQRRALDDAAVYVAAAGFPYSRRPPIATSVDADRLEHRLGAGHASIPNEIAELRIAHLAGLFAVLPAHVRHAVDGTPPESAQVRELLEMMPKRDRDELLEAPGRFLDDVLEMVWRNGQALVGLAR